MNAREVLLKKRDGGELSDAEIESFVAGAVDGSIADYQTSVLLSSIFRHGFTTRELAAWTRAMLHSGSVLNFDSSASPRVDKHSTGGVGDKVSIPLAPAVAACGVAVPMISGRGLGHTGGTLDKLEAIPGFRTQLAPDEFGKVLGRCGVAFGGQTPEIVPADKKFYALRDATGLVESVPLIASSILSKKLAEGLDALVLDVKFGSGAFLPEIERGRELARTMLELAGALNLRASVFLTSMARPLGRSAGHTLEIAESIECLRGGGPPDLRSLVLTLGAEMLRLANAARDEHDGIAQISRALDSGRALDTFRRVLEAQGGDPRVIDDPSRLGKAPHVHVVVSARAGWLSYTDVRALGNAIRALGGGRQRMEDTIDPTVGIVFESSAGARVEKNQALFRVHHGARGLEGALEGIGQSFTIVDAQPPADELVVDRMLG